MHTHTPHKHPTEHQCQNAQVRLAAPLPWLAKSCRAVSPLALFSCCLTEIILELYFPRWKGKQIQKCKILQGTARLQYNCRSKLLQTLWFPVVFLALICVALCYLRTQIKQICRIILYLQEERRPCGSW